MLCVSWLRGVLGVLLNVMTYCTCLLNQMHNRRAVSVLFGDLTKDNGPGDSLSDGSEKLLQ